MKCSYTVYPTWFGGQAEARKGVAELAMCTLGHMRKAGVRENGRLMCWWDVVSVYNARLPDYLIATIEYGS
jgi:hypothetical protein